MDQKSDPTLGFCVQSLLEGEGEEFVKLHHKRQLFIY